MRNGNQFEGGAHLGDAWAGHGMFCRLTLSLPLVAQLILSLAASPKGRDHMPILCLTFPDFCGGVRAIP